MKKTMVTILVFGIGLVGYQAAFAGPGWSGGMRGPGGGNCACTGGGPMGGNADPVEIEKRTKFFDETVDLRKSLAIKKAETAAVMSHEKPDEKRAGQLAGEIFELRNEMRTRAAAAGINSGGGYFCDGPHGEGMGAGMREGRGWHRGPGGMYNQ